MIGSTVDATRRTRIRALVARMHRVRIAHVFSIFDGAVDVDDESALADDQRLEAMAILEEVATASIDVEDVATASRAAAMVLHYVKTSCPTCHGGGLVRRGNADDLCSCVDRRWQAAVDRQAFVDGLRAPGRVASARVESTRAADAQERITTATDAIARTRAAASAACADLDAKIEALEVDGAAYFAERGQLDASRAKLKARAEEQARSAKGSRRAVAEALDKVEEAVLRIGQIIEPLFSGRLTESVDDDRTSAHAILDATYAAAAEASLFRTEQRIAEEAAHRARYDERSCEQRIAVIDADNRALVDDIGRLRAERGRIMRHHLPKIDRAERRLRRLIWRVESRGECGQ